LKPIISQIIDFEEEIINEVPKVYLVETSESSSESDDDSYDY
jgi:hypothetical protein